MIIRLSLCLWFLLGAASPALAGPYPEKPIRLVVPMPPGGPADLLARTVSGALGDALGQPVLVENRGGGNGNIGAAAVAHAAADGYTLLLLNSGLIANQSLYANLPFDLQQDFTPVAGLATFALMLVLHPSIPPDSVRTLIAQTKAAPGTLTYGSGGSGGGAHLAAASFCLAAGLDMVHVPYRGTGPAVADLVGGHVALMFASIPSVIQHVQAGRLKALALTAARRSAALPGLPTVSEAGVPGFEASSWFGLAAPGRLPQPLVAQLNAQVNRVLAEPGVHRQILGEGGEPMALSPAAFGQFISEQSVYWQRVIRQTGVHLE
jgi:tripartite-type tricarboxylate transporter receptor subunit TctC